MSQDKYKDITSVLVELGFTELEALIYCYLIENSPATPYRVAQAIGRPVANTYKAVESLFQKGLIMIDDTKSRLCQAVPSTEILGRVKRSFMDSYEKADKALSGLRPSAATERIFSLVTKEQVFEKCRDLVDRSRSIVLVDAFPEVAKDLKPWLESAARRNVRVIMQAYEPTVMKGVKIVQFSSAVKMLERWSGNWLIVVVDGSEYLSAYIGEDGNTIQNAIWCKSAFLSLPQHSNLAMSMRACILEQMLEDRSSPAAMKRMLRRTEEWLVMGKPGYEELATKFSGS